MIWKFPCHILKVTHALGTKETNGVNYRNEMSNYDTPSVKYHAVYLLIRLFLIGVVGAAVCQIHSFFSEIYQI